MCVRVSNTCHIRAPSASGTVQGVLRLSTSTLYNLILHVHTTRHQLSLCVICKLRTICVSLCFACHDTDAVMSVELDLGKLQLHHSVSRLRLASRTTIKVSSTDHGRSFGEILNAWPALKNVWICRGQGLALKFHVTLHGEPLPYSYLHELGRAICNFKVCLPMKPDGNF